jgi:hypothetical protein
MSITIFSLLPILKAQLIPQHISSQHNHMV